MKTNKFKVYWKFCEYSVSGISYSVTEYDNCSYHDELEKFTFLCEIDIPIIDKDLIQKKAVEDIDSQILEKNMELEKLRDKKQQLLALECTK